MTVVKPIEGKKAAAQPISTAPRLGENDETILLLLFDDEWHIGWWHPQTGWTSYTARGVTAITPTHWLPVPQTP